MVPEEGALEVMLLRQQAVQEDLKLTESEIDKIHKHGAKQWEKAVKVNELSEAEQDKEYAKMTKENERFVEETLTKEQLKRLHQITLQSTGLLCVTRPDVAAKLKLTEEQKKRAPKLQKEARREVEELVHATSKEQKREKMRELHETSRLRLLELLTDEQEATWKEMTGRPLKGEFAFYDGE